MENQKKEKEITLAFLFEVLKKSLIVMLIAAVALGALAALYAAFIDKPQYRATASFWVNNSSNQYDYATQQQQYGAIALASSCVELVSTDMPVRRAVEKYGLAEKLGFENDDRCVAALRSMISAKKLDNDSVVFYVTVTGNNPNQTYETVTAMQGVVPEVLEELLGLNRTEGHTALVTVIGPVNSVNDVATVKTSPVKLALIAAVVAAVLVYIVFLILAIFDTSVYGEQSIIENFDLPIVGNIPAWGSGEQSGAKKGANVDKNGVVIRDYKEKLLTEKTPFFVSEAFNTVRTNVIFSAAAAKNPVFAVTSDITGAGKTVMAVNLAIALANLDKKVLLVEADMRCPVFTKVFGKKPKAGLSELLAGMSENTEDVIENVGYNGLDVIFGGKIPPNPSELLSGFRMQELVEKWRENYDYIVLDTPPIGEIFDAGAIAGLVNGYILTVRCNHSNINDVKTAQDRVKAVGGNILGVIINDVDPKLGKGKKKYYRSYRGYGYGEKKARENA